MDYISVGRFSQFIIRIISFPGLFPRIINRSIEKKVVAVTHTQSTSSDKEGAHARSTQKYY